MGDLGDPQVTMASKTTASQEQLSNSNTGCYVGCATLGGISVQASTRNGSPILICFQAGSYISVVFWRLTPENPGTTRKSGLSDWNMSWR